MELAVISFLVSLLSLVVSGLAVFLAFRNQEVHIYHEPEDENQRLS